MRETLIILGTFLPAIGLAATAVVATATRGARRWTVLAGLPALTSVACWMVIDPVWSNGNLLAAAVYMSFFVTMLIYYPVLAVVGVVLSVKASRDRAQRSSLRSPG